MTGERPEFLMAPGPTEVPPDVLQAQAREVPYHRGPRFGAVIQGCIDALQRILFTKNDVLLLTGSGSLAMESAVVNLCSPGDKILVLDTGNFGERFRKIAKIYGVEAVAVEYEWGTNAKPEDIERELRAQIETLKRHLPRLSHASAHMGAATATPGLREISEKLCKEYGLRLEAKGTKPLRGWGGAQKSGEQKEADLAAAIEKLEPGTWLIIEHPGVDSEEMRAIGHKGYENVAADRAGVTRAFTSDRVKEALRKRGVRLISHLDLPRE